MRGGGDKPRIHATPAARPAIRIGEPGSLRMKEFGS